MKRGYLLFAIYIILFNIITSCNLNKYVIHSYEGQSDIYISPPSRVLIREIKFDAEGRIKGNKIAHVNVLNLKNSIVLPAQEPPEEMKVSQTSRGESLAKRQKIQTRTNTANKVVKLFLHFGKRTSNLYSSWNYEHLYDNNTKQFDSERFITLTNALRVQLEQLENNEYDNGTTIINEEGSDFVLFIYNDFTNKMSLKQGQSQMVLNTFYDHLVLPNSIALYNYGYITPEASVAMDMKRYVYFLDAGFGFQSIVNPIGIDTRDSSQVRNYFGLGSTAHFKVYREAEGLYIGAGFNKAKRRVKDEDGAHLASSPIDYSGFGGKYILVTRSVESDQLRDIEKKGFDPFGFRKDIMLIGIDNLEEAKAILNPKASNFDLIKNISSLRDADRIVLKPVVLQNSRGFQRQYFAPTYPVYSKVNGEGYVQFVPYGSRFHEFENHNLKRIRRWQSGQNTRRKVKSRVRGKTPLESQEIIKELIVKPHDVIRSK